MEWSYKFSSENPESVFVDIVRAGHHRHRIVVKRCGTLEYGKREPVSEMFERGHNEAREYIRESREAARLTIEGNKRGKNFAT